MKKSLSSCVTSSTQAFLLSQWLVAYNHGGVGDICNFVLSVATSTRRPRVSCFVQERAGGSSASTAWALQG
ncbi:hypothetical protein RRG08_050115 [Elysia crispata]|uniref:Uncharacterized protein n=1 Tax=Elysia crispata TaxID=231223 RepID=A0AAE0Z634_9GAST|nr:hypothetical protein RRG08_050115 [Elysia crispata]